MVTISDALDPLYNSWIAQGFNRNAPLRILDHLGSSEHLGPQKLPHGSHADTELLGSLFGSEYAGRFSLERIIRRQILFASQGTHQMLPPRVPVTSYKPKP